MQSHKRPFGGDGGIRTRVRSILSLLHTAMIIFTKTNNDITNIRAKKIPMSITCVGLIVSRSFSYSSRLRIPRNAHNTADTLRQIVLDINQNARQIVCPDMKMSLSRLFAPAEEHCDKPRD